MFKNSLTIFLLTFTLFSAALPKYIPYRKGSLWGYADSTGKILIECKYSYADTFYKGKAIAGLNGKIGLLDTAQKWIINPQYSTIIKNSSDIYFAISDSTMKVFSANGKIFIPGDFKRIYSFTEADYSDGLMPLEKNQRIGFYNTKGKLVIQHKYTFTHPFSEGLAIVVDQTGNKILILDKSGKERELPTQFTSILTFYNKRAAVALRKSEHWTIVNRKLQIVGDFKSLTIPEFFQCDKYHRKHSFPVAWASQSPNVYGIIDTNGVFISSNRFSFHYDFYEGLAAVTLITNDKINKTNYINEKCELLLKENVEYNTNFSNGFAYVYKNKKYAVIDNKGNFITKYMFDKVNNFSENLSWVCVGNKWGLINSKGEWVLLPEIESSSINSNYFNGLSKITVLKNGIETDVWIDKYGKWYNED